MNSSQIIITVSLPYNWVTTLKLFHPHLLRVGMLELCNFYTYLGPRAGGNYNDNDDRRQPTHEVSQSPQQNHHGGRGGYRNDGYGHGGGRGGGGGGFVPIREHTQQNRNFSPPPGFFGDSEDSPAHENYENLGNMMREFSTRTRDGCQKVNKGDMTCYVCRDAKGGNKEECMYASNDPKSKAMAYHEVSSYSSPTVSVLPAPVHAALLGLSGEEGNDKSPEDGSLVTAASSISVTSTPVAEVDNDGKDTVTSVKRVKSPLTNEKGKKRGANAATTSSPTSSKGDKDKKKNVQSVKSTRIAHSSTVIVHERSRRSPNIKHKSAMKEYDFDYWWWWCAAVEEKILYPALQHFIVYSGFYTNSELYFTHATALFSFVFKFRLYH